MVVEVDLKSDIANAVDDVAEVDDRLNFLAPLICRLHLDHIHPHAWGVQCMAHLLFNHDEAECGTEFDDGRHYLCQI